MSPAYPRHARTDYSRSELMPDVDFFRCVKMQATIQVAACVGMWGKANEGKAPPERLFSCIKCEVGACHAGATKTSFHFLKGTTTCARCHRSDLRLIGGDLCVSCKNREYEYLKGKNAKGKFPVTHPNLARMGVNVLIGGAAVRVERKYAAARLEVVVQVLRDSADGAVFGMGRGQHE